MEINKYIYKSIFRRNICIKDYNEYMTLLLNEHEEDIDNIKSIQVKLFDKFMDEFLKDDIKKRFKNFIAADDENQAFILIKNCFNLNQYSEKYDTTITISGIISLFIFFEYKNILSFFRENEKDLKDSIISTLEKYKSYDTLPLYKYIPIDDRTYSEPAFENFQISNIDLTIKKYDFNDNFLNFPTINNNQEYSSIDDTKKSEIPQIDFGSFDGKMVCNGALLKCTKGGSSSTLQILPTKQIFLNNQAMAFISDTIPMVNIMSFGACLRQSPPPPCVPSISGKWNNEIRHFLSSEAAVSTDSTCKCNMGGTISIVNEGQNFMGFSKGNTKDLKEDEEETENSEKENTTNYYLSKEKAIEESLASKDFNINKAEYFREKLVEEAEFWIDNISYFKDNLIKTQKLNKKNPPPYMDEDDFISSLYLTVLNVNIGENILIQYTRGKEVSKNSLLKGDVVFFDFDNSKEKIPDHVGIFIGENKFIHIIGNNSDLEPLKVCAVSLNSSLGPALKSFSSYISKVIRIIQDDNTYYNTEFDNGDLPNIKGVKS